MNRVLRLGTFALGAVALATVSVPGTAFGALLDDPIPSAPSGRPTDNYRVVPGDNLVINVFEKPELSRNLLVPPDGKITYPFLGELKVSGLTLEEIRLLLTMGLKKQLSSPQVSIELAKRLKSEVSILGVVRSPGKQPLEDGWHLLDLISASGGMSINRPELTRGTLVRNDGAERIPIDMDKLMSGDPDQNKALQPGDTFLIREQEARNFSMMVIGEVNRPGLAEVPKSGSWFEMFAGMGGFKPGAAITKARLTRKGQTVILDMSKLMADGTVKLVGSGKGVVEPTNLAAQPGDILVVEKNELYYTIWGGVARSGRAEFPEDGKVGVLDALSAAGGPIPVADLRNAAIMRQVKDKDEWETIPVNLEELRRTADPKNARAGKKPSEATVPGPLKDVALQAGDILFVPIKETQGGPRGFGLRDALGMLPFLRFVVN